MENRQARVLNPQAIMTIQNSIMRCTELLFTLEAQRKASHQDADIEGLERMIRAISCYKAALLDKLQGRVIVPGG